MQSHDYHELRDAGLAPPARGPMRNPRQASAYLLERHGIVRTVATLNKLRGFCQRSCQQVSPC
jgi:hypothetical protein